MKEQIEKLNNDITECYGCDPMYYGTDGAFLAENLVKKGWRKQEWISVEERLPESRKFVIVCDEYGNVGEAYFYKQDRKFEWVDDEEIAFATHWMPLPEAPKMKGGAK